MLVDYPQSLTNDDILGQGNLNIVREKSGKSQGILLSIICGNPVLEHLQFVEQNFAGAIMGFLLYSVAVPMSLSDPLAATMSTRESLVKKASLLHPYPLS